MTKKRKRYFSKGTNWPTKYNDDDLIEIPGFGTPTYREANNLLRKSWKKFKIAKSKEDEISMEEAIEAINRVQVALEIPVTNFHKHNAEQSREVEKDWEAEPDVEEEEEPEVVEAEVEDWIEDDEMDELKEQLEELEEEKEDEPV